MREGRSHDELRALEIVPDFVEQAHGSALISFGRTRVLCAATIEEGVPRWLAGSGQGWLTAEYGMLPASTSHPDGARGERRQAEGANGRDPAPHRSLPAGRVPDGRARRADGLARLRRPPGRRRHAHRGHLRRLGRARAGRRRATAWPRLRDHVAAVSVGLVEDTPLLDLDYTEDAAAEVDMNVVMTGDGRLIEVQATAEGTPFGRARLDELLELAAKGIAEIVERQREAVAGRQ